MKRTRLMIATAWVLGTAVAGCAPVKSYTGYVTDEAKPAEVQANVDTKSTVLERLGSPSLTSTLDPNVWYYVSSKREEFAFYRPKTVERSVTEIKFAGDETVNSVRTYKLEDGRVVDYAKAETPTLGRELTVFEQIFGNIGQGSLMAPDDQQRR